jgi:hypothetical protein
MSKQRIVKDEIWDDDWFYELDPSEKLVWIFLLTNPRGNIAGIYKLNKKWASQATGLDFDVFKTILSRFVRDGKIVDEESWIGLVNFHKHLAYRNTSVAQGIVRLYRESTGCPQALYSLWVTLLNSTLLNLSDGGEKSPQLVKEIKEILMAWKKYSERDHADDEVVIDADSGEEVVDNSEKEQNEKVTALIEWAEKIRGKKFIDTPTQRKMIHDMRKAKFSPQLIKDTFVSLVHSEYWQKQDRLPDFKTVLSNLKNKK